MVSKIKSNKKRLKEIGFFYTLMAWPLLLFLLFFVYLNFSSFVLAFQDHRINGDIVWAGLKNFKEFIAQVRSDGALLQISFTNSIKFYLITLVVTSVIHPFFAYLLFKKVWLHKFLRFSFLFPMVISGLIYAIIFKMLVGTPFQNFMIEQGFTDFPNLLKSEKYSFYVTVAYSIWVSFGMAMIIFPNAMNSISADIFESAQIDGLDSMFAELWYIILPLIYPTLTTFWILGFSGILTAGGPLVEFYRYTAPEYLYNTGYYYTVMTFTADNYNRYPFLAAGGMLMTGIVAPLTIGLRYLLERVSPLRDV